MLVPLRLKSTLRRWPQDWYQAYDVNDVSSLLRLLSYDFDFPPCVVTSKLMAGQYDITYISQSSHTVWAAVIFSWTEEL